MYTDSHLITPSDLQTFLSNPLMGDIQISWTIWERATWIFDRLIRFKYLTLSKRDKGIVLQYLKKLSGITSRQLDRHVKSYKSGKKLCQPYKREKFSQTYTTSDITLLSEVDTATNRLSGSLTITLMRNEYQSGDIRFVRMKDISVAGLYRLRGSRLYREKDLSMSKTKSTKIPIWKRMKPQPQWMPGFIRVDTVHQGDLRTEWTEGTEYHKWVYHVNLVDEVTQWEIVLAVEEISERFLMPVLEEALEFFPFEIKNFHSDNGSEYINYTVARLLEKLRISQTKSRPRKSTDNGLVEGKNGAIIRKEFGHWHIPGVFASRINRFYGEHLIPYLNFARPCHFPVKIHDPKTGKILIKYPLKECKTPYEKLLSLENWTTYLKSSISVNSLHDLATEKSPLQRAKAKKEARDELLKIVLPRFSNTLKSTTPENSDFNDFFRWE